METFKQRLRQCHDTKMDILVNVRKNYQYIYAIIKQEDLKTIDVIIQSEQEDLKTTQPVYFFTKDAVQNYIDKHLEELYTNCDEMLIKTVAVQDFTDSELIDVIMKQ